MRRGVRAKVDNYYVYAPLYAGHDLVLPKRMRLEVHPAHGVFTLAKRAVGLEDRKINTYFFKLVFCKNSGKVPALVLLKLRGDLKKPLELRLLKNHIESISLCIKKKK